MRNKRRIRLFSLLFALILLLSSCSESFSVFPDLETTKEAESGGVLSDGSESPSVLSAGFCPSKGKVTLPVIPIGFSDAPFTADMLVALKVALNSEAPGSKTSGGAAGSVSSFYKESSYGALDLSFDVLPTVTMTLPSFVHQFLFRHGDSARTDAVLSRAMKKLDGEVDFSRYDSDGNGALDGVMLIYSVPEESEAEKTLWWSWFDYTWRTESYDCIRPMGYVWSSSSCLYSFSDFSMTEEIDPYILIHETGHLFGLEDYYDTDPENGTTGGLAYFDMMDADFGDHNPFSKYQLGWVEPTVVTEAGEYDIRDFSASGDCLLIPFGDFEGFGSEYVLIDLFTPSGLGVLAPYWFGITTPIIRVWHVDADVIEGMRLDQYENLAGFFVSDNSSSGHKLLSYVEADGNGSLDQDDAYAEASDFFSIGSVIEGITSYSGSPLPFTIEVSSIKNGSAHLVLTRAAE
ncbi:MAG: hypothetical protein MJ141_02425 [Clostridia bacterium]|nr:hypothetical protein [Clostridia bacterium]